LNNPLDATGHSSHAANVTVLAGNKGFPGGMDGSGSLASFNNPGAICSDGANLYVADQNGIRKIVIATGVVTTVGTGGGNVVGICTDGTNLYLSDSYSNRINKVIIATGAFSIFAGGDSSTPGTTDGTGTSARFKNPLGICTDGSKLYVADYGNNSIRQIVILGAIVTTLAGSLSGQSGSTDGTGTAALFNAPSNLFLIGSSLGVCQSTYSWQLRIIQLSTATVSTQNMNGSGAYLNGSAVYDGNQFLYGIGNGLSKIDTSSWYGLRADITGYSASSLCMAGTDVYITDQGNQVVLKLVDIK
jgi:hypothetical protein